MSRPPRAAAPNRVSRRTRRDLITFVGLMGLVGAVVVVYALLFHVLMAREGQSFPWLTGLYWTLQTMSTLGYGDVVFRSTTGHMFSLAVLATGITVLFIILPFTLVQLFYAPWLEARAAARAPGALPVTSSRHVLLTAYGPIEAALIERLEQFRMPYAVVVASVADALALHDRGVQVMVGGLDDPQTWRNARVEQASLVAATLSDAANANIALTVREVSESVPIVATAVWENSVDLLREAGCQEVVQLGELLGRAMAVRIASQDGRSHVVGRLEDLMIAEAAAANTPLVGHTIRELELRERFGVNVVGVWERGRYLVGTPDVTIRQDSVLLISGTAPELAAYDAEAQTGRPVPPHVVVIGGGRVGRSTARLLGEFGIPYCIVEQEGERVRDRTNLVIGDATNPEVLREAGIERAASVAVTTRDDDVNTYLTLQCRHLRPDVQILGRATHERNIGTIYRAGADVVLSYFPMEANAIFGVLRRGHLLLLAEGLDLFTVRVPKALVGLTLAQAGLREKTGCNVLAVRTEGGPAKPPEPQNVLAADASLVLIGDRDAARRYLQRYGWHPGIG